MKRRQIIVLVLSAVLLLCAAGARAEDYSGHTTENLLQMKTEIDAELERRGVSDNPVSEGAYVEYTAAIPDGSEGDLAELRDEAIRIMRDRLDSCGLEKVRVQALGSDGIRVEIPSLYFTSEDFQYILDLISARGEVLFRDPAGEVFMTGEMVKSAECRYVDNGDDGTGAYQIEMELTEEGASIFGDYTIRYMNQFISIWLDDEALVNARIYEPILDGACTISGNYTEKIAREVAAKIQAGSLPVVLIQDRVDMWAE